MRNYGPVATRPQSSRDVVGAPQTTNLADLLERVLDKGVVIAGDIIVSLGTVELLSLKVRLLIASIDKAQEIGIDWWQSDPALSSRAKEPDQERDLLKERLDRLERSVLAPPQERAQEPETRQNADPAYVLDKEGRVITELKTLQEEEQPQTQECVREPEAEQAEQTADSGQLLGQALQERIAQAVRPVFGELQQRIAQAPQPVEQGRPEGQRGPAQPQEEAQPQAQGEAAHPDGPARPAAGGRQHGAAAGLG